MALKKEDFEEFQRQLELQNQLAVENKPKTKVDDDGTVYEWDEDKKAWFPSLSVDIMKQYHSTYSNENADGKTELASYLDPLTKTKYTWDSTADKWVPASSYDENQQQPQQGVTLVGDAYEYTDPKTKQVYKWNATSQQWYLKGGGGGIVGS